MKDGKSQIANRKSRFTFYVLRLALLVILLLAASLRFYRLDAQSFWNDEGNSARLSERTIGLIVEGTASDIHPPGYYLLLHYWRAVFGHSEFALRALSAVAGLALVLFTYLLGRRLFGQATGLMAAFLGAISPFAIYYSQEARMYALLGALAAASTYLLVRLLSNFQSLVANRRISEWMKGRMAILVVAYSLVAAAGLYTHYAFPFVLLVHNLIFALGWLVVARRTFARWRWLAAWTGVQISIAVLYLPWLPIALRSVTGWPSAGQSYELAPALLNVMRWLAVGNTLGMEKAGAALIGAGVLLAIGLWPRKGRWFGVASLALYLLLPIALVFVLDLHKEAWLKFLIVVLPPFHLVIARGSVNPAWLVSRGWRLEIGRFRLPNLQSLASLVTLILASVAVFPSLHTLYFDPAYFRDDYRQIASDISADVAASAGADTAVILNAPNQWEVFTYYYPDRDVYPAPYRPSRDRVEEFLSPLVAGYDRLFVVAWGDAESDPQRLVESWLAANAYKADDRWYGRVRLAMYGTAPLPQQPAVTLDAGFGEAMRLLGYALSGDSFAPGGILPVTLFWEARAPASEPYKVTVQLLGDGGKLVAQHDGEPVGGFAPTTIWQPGQAVTDRHGILLPADLPPGGYTLVVAVYHAATGERLPVAPNGEPAGDHLSLTGLTIPSSP
ncbi:MAG: glycosyltransferase family 39 protein [Anaerolineae bacterium]|nr:glycosyltransferase family 39 protein [Anaerolineae bacterium]